MYGEFDFKLMITSDPSSDDDGDLCDFDWLERISKQKHVCNVPIPVAAGASAYFIGLSLLMQAPKLVVLRTNKNIEIALGGAGATRFPINVVGGRFGYFILSAPSLATSLYIWSTDDAELDLVMIGDDQ